MNKEMKLSNTKEIRIIKAKRRTKGLLIVINLLLLIYIVTFSVISLMNR